MIDLKNELEVCSFCAEFNYHAMEEIRLLTQKTYARAIQEFANKESRDELKKHVSASHKLLECYGEIFVADLIKDKTMVYDYNMSMSQLYLISSILSLHKELADRLGVEVSENYNKLLHWELPEEEGKG